MKNKHITISLFRVSADSKYLDMIFDCPADFYFDSLTLQVKYVQDNIFKTEDFDLSPALFNTSISDKCTISKKHWTVRLPLEKLGISVPAIYSGHLKASYLYTLVHGQDFNYGLPAPYNNINEYEIIDTTAQVYSIETGEAVEGVFGKIFSDCEESLEEINDWMICSDVNNAYRCMLDDLLKDSRCETVSDDAIRKYLLLYGHQAALFVKDMETAEVYFKLIGNCFNNCPSKDRPSKHVQPCNCGK